MIAHGAMFFRNANLAVPTPLAFEGNTIEGRLSQGYPISNVPAKVAAVNPVSKEYGTDEHSIGQNLGPYHGFP
jgi:hypothetical protein